MRPSEKASALAECSTALISGNLQQGRDTSFLYPHNFCMEEFRMDAANYLQEQ